MSHPFGGTKVPPPDHLAWFVRRGGPATLRDMSNPSPVRLGVVGVDSSHLPAFTSRLHDLRDAGEGRCTVTHYLDTGRHFLPEEHVEKWKAQARDMGVAETASMDDLLGQVDGVMVLSVNGHEHLPHARPALERGLPTYIDKPLTCSPAEARELAQIAEKTGARCYSASSLRFVTELEALAKLPGERLAVDVVGPGELNDAMAGLYFYGVHAVELADAILGPGVEAVSAITMPDRDLVRLRYADGRLASLRLEREGKYAFGATVHTTEALHSFVVDFGPVYARLVRGMSRFFEGGEPPVSLDRIVENVLAMEAGNRSMKQDGAWVELAGL